MVNDNQGCAVKGDFISILKQFLSGYLADQFHDAIYFSGRGLLFGESSFMGVKVYIPDFLLRAYSVVSDRLAVDNVCLGVFGVVSQSVTVNVVW